MRKHLLHWLLPLVMLFSQQGAVWHGVGHLTDGNHRADQCTVDAGSTSAHADDAATPELCDLCLAFGDLLASARSEPVLWTPPVHQHVQAPADIRTAPWVTAPPARSRGPPLAL